MKRLFLNLERIVLGFFLVRFFVLFGRLFFQRVLWLWGRIRFGVLVQKRGIGCVCHWNADLKHPKNIELGDYVVIGVNASIGAHSKVIMGNRVRISRDVFIETAGLDFASGEPPYRHLSHPISIEDGVWIGARSIILGGVTLGKNSVVAAGSVVTKNVPPNSIVGGIPAKVISNVKNSDDKGD
ncbi:MAG: acyltransferase [Zoogloea sp.]|uniref:acyltransferase n=1 Tax=Zoogloea sp. TaxID=49181 RepID=UPI002605D66D|nr:acyltransferase [Zoogloea sp.]MDD3326651.1 acyltransferase [Zoogloea sp.]